MKKIILLFISCIFLTGCQLDYKLDFSNDKISETIVGVFDDDIYEISKYLDGDNLYIEKELVEEDIPALIDSENYYKKIINVKNGTSTVTLNYDYNYETFEKSYMADRCFENKFFINDENYYYLSLSGEFYCFENSDIKIKISTDKKVISQNSDEYKDGYYIWNLKISDEEHNINFQISKDILAEEEILKEKINIFPIIGIIILAIAVAMFLILKKIINKEE